MSTSVNLRDGLRPLSDLKSRASEVVRGVQETGRPVVITRHGRGIAVLVSLESFERLQALEELQEIRRAVSEGLEDVEAGRTVSHDELLKRWESKLGVELGHDDPVD